MDVTNFIQKVIMEIITAVDVTNYDLAKSNIIHPEKISFDIGVEDEIGGRTKISVNPNASRITFEVTRNLINKDVLYGDVQAVPKIQATRSFK